MDPSKCECKSCNDDIANFTCNRCNLMYKVSRTLRAVFTSANYCTDCQDKRWDDIYISNFLDLYHNMETTKKQKFQKEMNQLIEFYKK